MQGKKSQVLDRAWIDCRSRLGFQFQLFQGTPVISATRGEDPFASFKLPSIDVKCSQKNVNSGNPFFHNSHPKVVDIFVDILFLLQLFTGILFLPARASPFFLSVCLDCHQLSAAKTHTMIASKFGNSWRALFCELQIAFKNVVKQFGKFMCFHNSHSKVVEILLFCAGVSWQSLPFLPLLFLFSWMFVLAAISYQLQKPIHRIWMNIVHVSMITLNLATRGEDPFLIVKLPFTATCSQKSGNLGNLFVSTILIQKLLTYFSFLESVLWHSLFFSPFFSIFLGCLFWLQSVISCTNLYIEYGWTSYICQWLPLIWQLVEGPFCGLQTEFS